MDVLLEGFSWVDFYEAEVAVEVRYSSGWWFWRKEYSVRPTYRGFMGQWRNVRTGESAHGDVREFCERIWYVQRWHRDGSSRLHRDA